MKTLIISHNPISPNNNMGKTLLSLFDAFNENDLCQLYIYPAAPSIKKCGSYFQITDKMVLDSILKFKACGRVVSVDSKNQQLFDKSQFEDKAFTNKKNKREIKLIFRSLIWRLGFWYNKSLTDWIKTQKPDVIFATGGVSSFFYPLVIKISNKFNLPIVTYVCDDFFFSEKKKDIISKIYYNILKKNIRKLILKSSTIVSICDPLSIRYKEFFDVNTVTVYTGVNIRDNVDINEHNKAKNISYFGNLFIGRNTALSEIGKALDEINEARKTDFKLNIYTNTNDTGIKGVFDGIKSVSVSGFVDADRVAELMNDSILLLHIEGFADEDIERVRYSMSTKIPESLNSGVCLFAYGPIDDASIEYLHNNNCAIVAETKEVLKSRLEQALFNEATRGTCIHNALKIAQKNHNQNKQSEKLKSLLEDASSQTKKC